MIRTQLIDARNFETEAPRVIAAMAGAPFIGIDSETEDLHRHDVLTQFGKFHVEGHKSKAGKLVFDWNRTTMCGFSLWPEHADTAWYVNLAHADVENRLPWETDVIHQINMLFTAEDTYGKPMEAAG